MSSSKNLIPISLIILFLSIFSLSEGTQNYCDIIRPPLTKCANSPYKPVCGYYTKDCPYSFCGKTLSSKCHACADPNIMYYEVGECPLEVQVNVCSPDVCDPDQDPINAYNRDYYSPVCGIKKKCNGKSDCDKTFSNICDSCTHGSYPYYKNGPCENDKQVCPKKRNPFCDYEEDEVCAYFTDADQISHFTTASSSCNACKDKAVQYYLPGACDKTLPYNQNYCLPNNRPTYCDNDYEPVCGFYKGPNGDIQHEILHDACTACSYSEVLYYTPGPCIFYCDRNPGMIYDCVGSLTPVCGAYKDSKGNTKYVSLRNGCVGCYYLSIIIDSYTDGLCPGDNGILCANNGQAFLDGILEPVCGLTTKNCNNKYCRKTYGDSMSACNNPSIVKYIPGVCPGDNGVPCDDFRNGNLDNRTPYGQVCGYSKVKCTKNSCRKNYADEYEACGNNKVLYFTAGACS